MTKITVRKTSTGYTGFTCIGHAGYAAAGSDIICAAISILVINTINSIDSFTEDEMNVVTNEEEGLIDVRFTSKISDKTQLLLDSMVLGLKEVKEQYGRKYLKLQFEEV